MNGSSFFLVANIDRTLSVYSNTRQRLSFFFYNNMMDTVKILDTFLYRHRISGIVHVLVQFYNFSSKPRCLLEKL